MSLPALGALNDDPSQTTFSNSLEVIRASVGTPDPGNPIGARSSATNRQHLDKEKALTQWSQSWSQWSRSEYSRTNG